MQSTLEGRHGPDANRTTARIVGVLFLPAFFVYGGGSALLASIPAAPDYLSSIATNAMPLRAGAVLMLINSLVVAAIGILMLRVARPHSEVIAFGYLGARLVEAVVLAVGVIILLLQIPLAREAAGAGSAAAASSAILSSVSIEGNFFAYQIGMIALGLGSVPFWILFYRTGLVPRSLAALGIVGYGIFASGAVLEILGFNVGLLLSIPGALFEASIGIWLIAKGFSSPVTAPRTGPAEAPIAVPA